MAGVRYKSLSTGPAEPFISTAEQTDKAPAKKPKLKEAKNEKCSQDTGSYTPPPVKLSSAPNKPLSAGSIFKTPKTAPTAPTDNIGLAMQEFFSGNTPGKKV